MLINQFVYNFLDILLLYTNLKCAYIHSYFQLNLFRRFCIACGSHRSSATKQGRTSWLVTGSSDNTARLWDLNAKDPAANRVVLRGHDGRIIAVAISPDSRWVVTGSVDKTARLWDLSARDPAAGPVVLRGQDGLITAVAISPDGPNGAELLRLLHAVVGQPLSPEALHFAYQQEEATKSIIGKIGAAIRNRDSDRLVELFRMGGLAFETSAALGCKIAEGLTKLGHNDEALSVLAELERRFPRAIRPKQLRALALARRGASGDLNAAQEILGELYEQSERDLETLEIYGRTWMDRYEKSGDRNALKQSRDLYIEAFERAPNDYYAGINAAAKSVLLGTEEHLARAAEYARKVQQIVGTEPRAGDYWMTATVAEVFLIQKKYEEAARLYEAAVATARSEIESHKTTWKQACRLMAKLQPSESDRELVREPFMHLPDCDQL